MLEAILTLGIIGIVAAVILYIVSKKFSIEEDTRVEAINEVLPGANCGGCGYAGCHALAEAIVKAGSCKGISCTAGGKTTASKVAEIMGEVAEVSAPKIAILRCNGSCTHAPAKFHYDSAPTCAFAHTLSSGESGCAFGCLGLGDCARACEFGGITIDSMTKLPHFDEKRCIACGSCMRACPRGLIEARTLIENNLVFVACKNQEKGTEAKKNCTAACIGCKKCEKSCIHGAISVENNLAYIDDAKCTGCFTCIEHCPTGAIHSLFSFKKELEKEA